MPPFFHDTPQDVPVEPVSTTVDITHSNTELPQLQKNQLQALLNEYRDIFAMNDRELGRTDLVEHHIDTGDASPVRLRPYRISEQQRQTIDNHVEDLLERDLIEPSVSPWAAPVVLVKKKDGTDRFCVDYRRLNAVTRKDVYPMPKFEDILDSMAGCKYFSVMDLQSGFWQVSLDKRTKHKTAFTTFGGIWQWKVLPMGLCNSPSTFQRLLECVLHSLNYKIALCYIDDIVVFSPTFDQHLKDLRDVFQRLREANIKLRNVVLQEPK